MQKLHYCENSTFTILKKSFKLVAYMVNLQRNIFHFFTEVFQTLLSIPLFKKHNLYLTVNLNIPQ